MAITQIPYILIRAPSNNLIHMNTHKNYRLIGLVLVAVLASFSADSAEASIVIDDFNGGALVPSDVARGDNINATFDTVSGNNGFVFTDNGRLNYRVRNSVGTSFGALGADFSNGITFSNSEVLGGSWTVALYGALLNGGFSLQESQNVSSGPISFLMTDISAFKRIQIRVNGFDNPTGPSGAFIGGSFSAVPEPTSLILVGIACAPFVLRRKRFAAI